MALCFLECSWKLWVLHNFIIICYDHPKPRREWKAGIPFFYTRAFLHPGIEANIDQMEEKRLGDCQRHQIGKTMYNCQFLTNRKLITFGFCIGLYIIHSMYRIKLHRILMMFLRWWQGKLLFPFYSLVSLPWPTNCQWYDPSLVIPSLLFLMDLSTSNYEQDSF